MGACTLSVPWLLLGLGLPLLLLPGPGPVCAQEDDEGDYDLLALAFPSEEDNQTDFVKQVTSAAFYRSNKEMEKTNSSLVLRIEKKKADCGCGQKT